jgi:hypothetical protein
MPWMKWRLLAAWACLILALPIAAQAQARFQIRLAEEKDKPAEAATELPAYWIGVALRDTDPSLLAHLKLDHGVMVGEVIDGSPAAKAGLKPLDIITHADDKAIKTGEDLLKAVADAKDKELTLTIYREAKKESVKVTPAKRPEDQLAPRAVETRPADAVERALRRWKDRAGPLELDLLGPGIVVRVEPAPLPDDMKIVVEKEGKKQPKVTVTQGNETWVAETKEDIEKLPEVARPHVRMMLGLPTDHLFSFQEKGETPRLRLPMPVEPPRLEARELRIERDQPLKRIEEELKQLRQQQAEELKQFRKDLEELRKRSDDR